MATDKKTIIIKLWFTPEKSEQFLQREVLVKKDISTLEIYGLIEEFQADWPLLKEKIYKVTIDDEAL